MRPIVTYVACVCPLDTTMRPHKRVNRSRCLDVESGGPKQPYIRQTVRIPHEKMHLGDIYRPMYSIRNIRLVQNLFDKWQQLYGLLLSVLQQLVHYRRQSDSRALLGMENFLLRMRRQSVTETPCSTRRRCGVSAIL